MRDTVTVDTGAVAEATTDALARAKNSGDRRARWRSEDPAAATFDFTNSSILSM